MASEELEYGTFGVNIHRVACEVPMQKPGLMRQIISTGLMNSKIEEKETEAGR